MLFCFAKVDECKPPLLKAGNGNTRRKRDEKKKAEKIDIIFSHFHSDVVYTSYYSLCCKWD